MTSSVTHRLVYNISVGLTGKYCIVRRRFLGFPRRRSLGLGYICPQINLMSEMRCILEFTPSALNYFTGEFKEV